MAKKQKKQSRFHVNEVTFETIANAAHPVLVEIARSNKVDHHGTRGDLRSRLRAYKAGRASRVDEKLCPDCRNMGAPTHGPIMTSHTVSRTFKCKHCGATFTKYQDTRKGGA